MREIKFRMWNSNVNKLTYGSNEFIFSAQETRPRIYTIEQYIGLKDKNKRDIYEGDIVKGVVECPQLFTGDTDENCNTNMGGVVYYDYNGFSLKVIESLCDKDRDGMCNYFDFMTDHGETFRQIEIIGNIHENPELLN